MVQDNASPKRLIANAAISAMAMALDDGSFFGTRSRVYVPRAAMPKLSPAQRDAVAAAEQERLRRAAAKRAARAARQAKGMKP